MLDLDAGLGTAAGFFLSILLHEVATAYASVATGDPTPRLYGRLRWSFKTHADPIGSYILPVIFTLGPLFSSTILPMFGWGKPHAMGTGRRSLLPVLAGPAATLTLAIVAGAASRAGAGSFAFHLAYVATSLTVIELLPIPGRDGGRILQRFLSPSAASTMQDLEKYGVLFLLVLFLILRGLVISMVSAVFDLVV